MRVQTALWEARTGVANPAIEYSARRGALRAPFLNRPLDFRRSVPGSGLPLSFAESVTGPGRFRFILQPMVAIVLGIR